MPCQSVKFPNGMTAILCTPPQRRRRCSNGQCVAWAERECDYPAPHRKTGTCDKPLCTKCAVRIAENVDHCPSHPSEPEQGRLAL